MRVGFPATLTIGSLTLPNNLILAPMAGVTDPPVRLLARRYGAALCFTEMVSANGVVRDGRKSFDLVHTVREDRPLGIQVFGDDPEVVGRAAGMLQEHGELMDINMGCPVRKVVGAGAGAGSALMRDLPRAAAMIRSVRRAVSVPLTVKIRSGWQCGEENYLELGRIAQEEGCDAVTLHPRTRSQMFSGTAAWEQIRLLKESLSIPVIASGDIFSGDDAVRVLETTGCDGVMIARGGMGNPWIFRDALRLLQGEAAVPPSAEERLADGLYHLRLLTDFSGEQVAVREMRKHFSWYSRGLPGAARFRGAVNSASDLNSMTEALSILIQAA